jgi:hypothetical protein
MPRIADVQDFRALVVKYTGGYNEDADHFEVQQPRPPGRRGRQQGPQFFNCAGGHYPEAEREDHREQTLEVV